MFLKVNVRVKNNIANLSIINEKSKFFFVFFCCMVLIFTDFV